MQTIVIVEGDNLRHFFANLGLEVPEGLHTLRIDQRGNGVAVKANSGMWSSTIGRRADAGGY